MSKPKNILAISGSTRSKSTNLNLIIALQNLYEKELNILLYEGIAELPHFNPEFDNDQAPSSVNEFRKLLRQSDGVIISTPEYAMGVPGTLKNALDWTVSSCEFSHKPVALFTASTSGEKAHAALLGTLKVIEANIDKTNLLISFAKTKISNTEITDQTTLVSVKEVMNAFINLLN